MDKQIFELPAATPAADTDVVPFTGAASGDASKASIKDVVFKSNSGTANQVLGLNAANTANEYKSLLAGTNVTIGHQANGITISAAGATGPQGAPGAQGATGATGSGGTLGNYGNFYSSATQTNLSANTAQAITLNNTVSAQNVSVVSNSQITFAEAGTYNIQFSLQLEKTDAGTDTIDIWLAQNGTNVAESNTRLLLDGNGAQSFAAWNWVVNVAAGDYIQIYWSSPDANIQISAFGASTSPSRPAIPSAIVTVAQVMYTQVGPQGFTGAQGATGATGLQGPQGDVGYQGLTGPQGSTGVQGSQGNTGVQGPQGATGPQGSTGTQGPQGSTGVQGPQGTTGNTGPQGPQGFTGTQGPQGYQGTPGPTGVVGPVSSTDNAIVRWDGTTGQLIQNSAATVDDTTGLGTFGTGGQIYGNQTIRSLFIGPATYNNNSGTDNVYVGHNAGSQAPASGSYNVFVGSEAGKLATGAQSSTAIGYRAGYDGVGTGFTFVGKFAGYKVAANGNVGVGDSALYWSSGSDNTAIGNNSQKGTTLAASAGAGNTSLGSGSLGAITSGNNNTAIGLNALRDNATASQNVGIGWLALAVNTAGQYNVAVGNSAGISTTNASYCTFVGQAAGNSSNGNWNTFIGGNCGQNVSSGGQNTFMGYNCGQLQKTGGLNVAIGMRAFQGSNTAANNTGQYNVAMGYDALNQNSSGSYNTGLGYNAGNNVDAGSGNTTVGANAFSGSATKFNVTNNTIIGREAGTLIAANNNTLVGSFAGRYFGAGTDNVALGNNSLYGVAGSSTGSYNTALGGGAGFAVTTGQYNSLLGYTAGSGITTGSYNTCLGRDAGSQLIDLSTMQTNTNVTCLGYNARVSGNNQVQLGDSTTTTYAYGAVQNRSDERDKADIADSDLGLNFIMELSPKVWKWDYREDYFEKNPETGEVIKLPKDGSKKRSRPHYGLVAQDVEKTLKKLNKDFGGFQDHKKNGGCDVLSLGYSELIAPMIKAIQEQQATIDNLTQQLIEVRARLTKLEGK